MATVATQIRIDSDVKRDVSALFGELGMDLSGAVNIFLRQCLIHNGLPFPVNIPAYKKNLLDAIAEAERISEDDSIPGYTNMEDLKKELES